jgi:hypothetical protein
VVARDSPAAHRSCDPNSRGPRGQGRFFPPGANHARRRPVSEGWIHLDEMVQRLRQIEADPRQSLCVEVGLDYFRSRRSGACPDALGSVAASTRSANRGGGPHPDGAPAQSGSTRTRLAAGSTTTTAPADSSASKDRFMSTRMETLMQRTVPLHVLEVARRRSPRPRRCRAVPDTDKPARFVRESRRWQAIQERFQR